MASPSRSWSVANTTGCFRPASSRNTLTAAAFSFGTTHSPRHDSVSTPSATPPPPFRPRRLLPPAAGRSLTWPKLAFTTYCGPKYR